MNRFETGWFSAGLSTGSMTIGSLMTAVRKLGLKLEPAEMAIIALRCCHLNGRFETYWKGRRAA